MLKRIISFSLTHRWLVLFIAAGLAALGIYNFNRLLIDAVPDITNVQVQINTEAPGYSPLESEQRITFPVETAMAGLPRLDYTRSISRYGLSQVTVIFKDGTDISDFRDTVLFGQAHLGDSGHGDETRVAAMDDSAEGAGDHWLEVMRSITAK